MAVSLTFPDSTYSSSNKPSTATLKTDLQAIETDHNAHLADTTIHFLASTLYPVGSIYINASVSTNPGTLLGFGTWAAYGAGRVIVGLDSGQTEFDTLDETGGAKTHTLTVPEMPAHTHTVPGNNVGGSGNARIDASSSTTVTSSSAGGGGAHNNLQPYIVAYMWKRTA